MLLWECFSASGSGEFCDSGNNYEERRIYEDSENFKLSAVKRELVHTSSHSSNKTKTCAKPWPESHWYSYRVDLRPRSIPEEHQIWRTPSDLPKENGLGLLIDVCEISSKLLLRNGCRLLSSKKDTQLTISIRRVNNFVPGKKQRNQKMLKNDFVKYFCFCVQSKIM